MSKVVSGLGRIVVVVVLAGAARGQDLRLPPPPQDPKEHGVELTPWLNVRPYLRETLTYTTNPLQEPNGRKDDDLVSSSIAGVDALIGDDDSWLDLGYAVTGLWYADDTSLGTAEHRVRFAAKASPGRWTLDAAGSGAWAVTNSDPQFAGRVRNFSAGAKASADYQATESVGWLTEGFFAHTDNFPRELEPFNTVSWGGATYATLDPNLPADVDLLAGPTYRQIIYIDHSAANPDLAFHGVAGGARLKTQPVDVDLRAGYEWGEVIRRRRFPRSRSVPEGFRGSGALTWRATRTVTLVVHGSQELRYAVVGAFQRTTHAGGRVQIELPAHLQTYATADWDLQEPKGGPSLRTQSYALGISWDGLDWLEVGAQTTYLRSWSRSGGYEVYTVSLGITLRLP